MDIIAIMSALLGAMSGLFAGYYLMPTNSHLRETNKMLKAKIASVTAEIREPPELPENIDLSKLDNSNIDELIEPLLSKLPIWARPLVNPFIQDFKQNPQKYLDLLKGLQKGKEGEKQASRSRF